MTIKSVLLSAVLFIGVADLNAQMYQSVTGGLIDQETNQPVPFAYVSLFKPDSTLAGRVVSDTAGRFMINQVLAGNYRLLINVLGYQNVTKGIVVSGGNFDLGIISLNGSTVNLNAVEVVGERIKARAERDKTTFFITKKIADASSSGTDLLKMIPGVSVDLMQKISVEGSTSIMILVDGKERDRNFVSQIDPTQIDKVEIISAPPSKYDASITGAINIVMKKERESGFSGQINSEVPVLTSLIYMQPSGSLNYGFKNLNLYASYSGEIIYGDLHESTSRKYSDHTGENVLGTDQYLRQKSWSHRLNYGIDYFLNPRNQINFYAFFNPYSRECNGISESQKNGEIIWNGKKEDTDINFGSFYSIYFKHMFNEKGNEIILDINNFSLKAENSTTFMPQAMENNYASIVSTVKPLQEVTTMKIDYNAFIGKDLSFSLGIKDRYQHMRDANSEEFRYTDNVFAAYGSFGYKHSKIDMNMGARVENSVSDLKNGFRNTSLFLLPYLAINYKLASNQNIQLTCSESVTRPNIYQLNPYAITDDAFSFHRGNSFLKPELHGTLFIEHSIRFKDNYVATRIFYSRISNAINNLTFMNDTSAFATHVFNLGTINQYGVQMRGAVKLGKLVTLNPYFRLYGLSTQVRNIQDYPVISDKNQIAFESGISAILSLKHDISASFIFQYSSPKNNIQDRYFSDALYFVTLEKTFMKKLKVGVVTALALTRKFTYQGTSISSADFNSYYEGNIKVPSVPFWFRLGYQFNPARKHQEVKRSQEEIDALPKKGF